MFGLRPNYFEPIYSEYTAESRTSEYKDRKKGDFQYRLKQRFVTFSHDFAHACQNRRVLVEDVQKRYNTTKEVLDNLESLMNRLRKISETVQRSRPQATVIYA